MWERVLLAVVVVGTVAGALSLGWASDWRYGVEDDNEPVAVARSTPIPPHFSGPEAAGHVEAWWRDMERDSGFIGLSCSDGDYHDGRWTVRCTIEQRGRDTRVRFYVNDSTGTVTLAD